MPSLGRPATPLGNVNAWRYGISLAGHSARLASSWLAPMTWPNSWRNPYNPLKSVDKICTDDKRGRWNLLLFIPANHVAYNRKGYPNFVSVLRWVITNACNASLIPACQHACNVGSIEESIPGAQFNRNLRNLGFGLKNHLSFGLRFPAIRKCSKIHSSDMCANQNGI